MKSLLLTALTVLAFGLVAQASPDDGGYTDYKVHTHCTFKSVADNVYAVHVFTMSKSGDWKVRLDLNAVDSRGREKVLSSRFAEYTQHTGGETFRSQEMRLEIYYVDISPAFPGGEKGIFDATLANGETFHFDGMSCRHADQE